MYYHLRPTTICDHYAGEMFCIGGYVCSCHNCVVGGKRGHTGYRTMMTSLVFCPNRIQDDMPHISNGLSQNLNSRVLKFRRFTWERRIVVPILT